MWGIGQDFGAVQASDELDRICALPRRGYALGVDFPRDLSSVLCPTGLETLRPTQARALYELHLANGLIASLPVGAGKTLISLLAPYVIGAARPMLILPAKLVSKTEIELRRLANIGWLVCRHIRIESYERLGRVSGAGTLDAFLPDMIIADECHKLARRNTGVTRRVNRYMSRHPNTVFVGLSGTLTNRSIREFAHILEWASGAHGSPLPHDWNELEQWSVALDEKTSSTCAPGALLTLANDDDYRDASDLRTVARRAVGRRINDTIGIVSESIGYTGSSLTIDSMTADMGPAVARAFETLRRDWTSPDGAWAYTDAMQVWAVARQIGFGFYYRFDPLPPEEWILTRRAWARVCRDILSTNRSGLDTALAVTQAIDQGYAPQARQYLAAWRAIKPTYRPSTVATWLSDAAINLAHAWAQEHPKGIIWVEHREVGEALERRGLPYYRHGGLNARGESIELAKGPIVASIKANAEGRNLQAWRDNLVLGAPTTARATEQLIGRTHRSGQTADEVTVTYLMTCDEHRAAWLQAQADALFVRAITGETHKILTADVLI